MNRDCWYLYTLHPEKGVTVPDQTLEVIMVDLDETVMSIFTQAVSSSARDATQKSGIDKIFPGMQIDDFLFTPCGYSMNGVTRSVSIVVIVPHISSYNFHYIETLSYSLAHINLLHIGP